MKLNKINDHIYQTGYKTAKHLLQDTNEYEQFGIRGIICPAYNARLNYPIGLAVLLLPIDDHDTVTVNVFEMIERFYRSYNPVLIHCMGGKNRSVAVTAVLASLYQDTTPQHIYRMIGSYSTKELQKSVNNYLDFVDRTTPKSYWH